ncbi:MAG: nucleoside-triphosphatase [Candidatus Nitrosocaldus sp.]|nr:nucleoside-triphosphatase [Candidatus Nitrosocaldus sp.]MDW7999696.1 nucleoside-triphosphatase [Candidatus Nitrosocaldus sp.]
MLILITGEPGVGKSTLLLRLVGMLKDDGVDVGGVVAREVRDAKDSRRTGFEFLDVADGSRARLASIGIEGPRIGRYGVDLDGCRAAAGMLRRAVERCRVVVFDEIGPMELLSQDMVHALEHLLDAMDSKGIVVVAVAHKRLRHDLVSRYRERASITVEVDRGNRDSLPTRLLYIIKDKWGRLR